MTVTVSDAQNQPEIKFPTLDHKQLPESDGSFVKNFQEHPQSLLLTDSIMPLLRRLHPDNHFIIGQDSGIYWREIDKPRDQQEHLVVAPDWFYIPDVAPLLDGEVRRSYVMWKELLGPFIVLEFASGDGHEERDNTPLLVSSDGTASKAGKFWVYERALRIPYYGIYEVFNGKLEVYHLEDTTYRKLSTNAQGRYPIPPLGIELGLWQGEYLQQQGLQYLRWWDQDGQLLLTGHEHAAQADQRAEQADQRAAQADQRAEQADQRAERLAEKLRALGVDPDTLE